MLSPKVNVAVCKQRLTLEANHLLLDDKFDDKNDDDEDHLSASSICTLNYATKYYKCCCCCNCNIKCRRLASRSSSFKPCARRKQQQSLTSTQRISNFGISTNNYQNNNLQLAKHCRRPTVSHSASSFFVALLLFALHAQLACKWQAANDNSFVVAVDAAAALADQVECIESADCRNSEKICHEQKCLCPKHLPIEDTDQDRCLAHSELGEQCQLNEQCLGDAHCLDGFCSCGTDVVIPNLSRNISYCHPRRALKEKCNFDAQCPQNSYCSLDKFGCLCQNGFAQSLIRASDNSGIESLECLPKFCSNSSACESEFHTCVDNKCVCMSAHFDIKTAKCHKFGSINYNDNNNEDDDINSDNSLLQSKHNNKYNDHNNLNNYDNHKQQQQQTNNDNNSNKLTTFFNNFLNQFDLSNNNNKLENDKHWLIIFCCIFATLLFIALLFLLIKLKPFKCWTAQKSEFKPNSSSATHSSHLLDNAFNKNSINNKSFRRKSNLEVDDGDELSAVSSSTSTNEQDKSQLVNSNSQNNTTSAKTITTKSTTTTTSPPATTNKRQFTKTTKTTLTTTSIMIDISDDSASDTNTDKCNTTTNNAGLFSHSNNKNVAGKSASQTTTTNTAAKSTPV